ncbi:hypothetical protein EDB92DRAFT_2103383 [Lactarius akahatsu]|uniref:Homeobox domain-containing protein n=1 Tax=Lactarius akahatsu TaxID=416441 RepID=A0AAD4LI70_9AGAM|nr:hypothetical protein EDB92DRAFT_2103383 [Lactarius akahatsu]
MPKCEKPGGGSLNIRNRSARVGAAPVVLRACLTEQDLRDLHVIWSRDQRIPTPGSRQKWAQHRGLAPATVGGWFSRRRARHIRLAGDEAALTGSYELNPSSPSNVTPHELPVKVQVRGSRACDRARTARGANFESGSERTDQDPSSDDTTFSHPGRLDQEVNLAVTETVTVMDSSSGEALPFPGLLPCDCEYPLCDLGREMLTLDITQHRRRRQRCGFLGVCRRQRDNPTWPERDRNHAAQLGLVRTEQRTTRAQLGSGIGLGRQPE